MNEDTPIPGPLNNVIRIDDERIKGHLDRVVRGTVEQTLNALLDAEADRLEKEHGKGNVSGEVKENLGQVTTREAKDAEAARLQRYYDETGKVPPGNSKSFKPEN